MHSDTPQLVDELGPEKVVCVSDRKSGMRGALVIDNSARGAGKGGTRMSPNLSVMEVARLARTMTWKWAAVDLFRGGAKAGIIGDPDAPNKEEVLRAFARTLANSPFPVDPDDVFAMISTNMRRNTLAVVDEARTPQPDHPRRGARARPGAGPSRDDAAGTDRCRSEVRR